MRNHLKKAEIIDELNMADDKQQNTDMKQHEKNPVHRIVLPDRRKKEGVVQGPEPFGSSLRKNLKCRGMFRLLPDAYQPDCRTDDQYAERRIDHGNKGNVCNRIQRVTP